MTTPVEQAQQLQELVRAHADQSEQQRHLAAPVAEAFARHGLYRIAAPEDALGSAADPLTQVETIEAVAYADGSAAWNLMIGIESFGLIAPGFGACQHLIKDPAVVMCSSTAAVGRADKVPGGYRINGRWQFVSGCHNSSLFGATVRVWDNGEMLSDMTNRYAMLERPQWEILDTWHTAGLCGSGSHDVVAEDAFIPETQLIAPIGGTRHDSPLLNFPLGARLAYNKVGIAWGLARAAVDAFVALAEGKTPRFSARGLRERPRAQRAVAEAEVKLRAGRALVVELLEQMWVQVQAREHITSEERALFQLACSDAVRNCIAAVQQLVEAAGTTANQKGHPLERIERDIKVVGQHITVAAHHIEDAGRLLLGLPAQEMMLAGMPAPHQQENQQENR
ncbi:MAG: acyl-CoA dehydrogenase family protein [Pseudomonadota bacterium]